MKYYYIYDNDNGILVCDTDSRKEAFTSILNHLIEANGTDVPEPIMFPMNSKYQDGRSVIVQAQKAYKNIIGFIPDE